LDITVSPINTWFLRRAALQKIVTASEMQAIDQCAIRKFNIPGIVLMENAGRSVVNLMFDRINDLKQAKVLVVCGKGNNGGDGFVIGRHLHNAGVRVEVLLLGKRSQIKNEARINADSVHALGIPILEIFEKNLSSLNHSLRHCRVIVDAIFGTGLSKPVTGLHKKVIEKINAANKFVVAVDIPSGINADTGQVIGPSIRANLTAALALAKRSHILYPAADNVGELEVLDIGIPAQAINSQKISVGMMEENDVHGLFPKRKRNTHKGNFGHVLVVGGSRGKGGAAALAALAALRMGAGLVTLAVPESCHSALEFHPLEVMSIPLPETRSGSIAPSALDSLLKQLKGKSALVVGPGLGTPLKTVEFLSLLLPNIKCPLVLDADGINCLAKIPEGLSLAQPEWVLTPHPKEMSRLTGWSVKEIQENRLDRASECAQKHNVTLVLKGAASVSAFPNGQLLINPTGNPGMATAGSGDVLAGMIAGLLAQGMPSTAATGAGVYLHGLAGDIYAEQNSETSLIAGDLMRTLPETLKRILP
jgi:NAD(P)H-hydrate epimerase